MGSFADSDIMVASDLTLFDKIKFLVGSDEVVIEARKGLLAGYSPVFKAMFFGSMAEKRDAIKLGGDCPQAFKVLVDFVHYKQLKVDDFESAMAVCLMAHKYIMPVLVGSCMKYMANIKYNYMLGLNYYECLRLVGSVDSRMDEVIKTCQRHAQDLFDSDRHLNVDIGTLVKLFKCRKLNITSDMVLIDALAKYKEVHDNTYVKEGIKAALMHVDFSYLNPVDVIESASLKQILSISELKKTVLDLIDSECRRPKMSFGMEYNRNWFYPALTRSTIIKNDCKKLMSHTLYTSKIHNSSSACIKGVILATPGDEVIPELDVILSISSYDKENMTKQDRFFLKNLDKAGRQCFIEHGMICENDFILTMVVLNDVSVSGAYTGPFELTKFICDPIDCVDCYPLTCETTGDSTDALLKGVLIDYVKK